MSCFQSAVVALQTDYPKAVVWSEENLVAVACGAAVIILNPHTPKVRGVITVPSSNRFPTGKIDVDGGGADLLNGCLLPYHLSRETRPCVRLISWSPAGLAKDVGLYQDKILQIRVVSEDHENLGEKNNWQIVSSSFYEGDPLEEVTEDCLPLISAQHSSNCCSILAVGGKCGKISLWRVRAPDCYSTDNAGHASEVRLFGLEKAHDSWITAISWVRYGSNDSMTQFALATGSSDGSPGLKSSTEFAHALDSCFGLSVSPGNLAVTVVRRYDSDLLDPMYEGR
ncbi:hypothetical protein SASPL_135508 [Salvia splendens]|uniref:Uncharacterized protein n=1 Tax=Salvia splendens TaxID=180675 RepID=A0A8X8X0B4_SALSN|nr:hypothetical protein SASPL_135508 [Salvia splendens]